MKKFKINCEIKNANWKSNFLDKIFNKLEKSEIIEQSSIERFDNITTSVIYQDGKFIETNSDFLFEIICSNFFKKFKNEKFNFVFTSNMGLFLADSYQNYFYDLMIKRILENYKIENSLSTKELFYKSKLEQFTSKYKAKIVFLISYLKINLKNEENKFHKLLFKIDEEMKDFYLEDDLKENEKIKQEIEVFLR